MGLRDVDNQEANADYYAALLSLGGSEECIDECCASMCVDKRALRTPIHILMHSKHSLTFDGPWDWTPKVWRYSARWQQEGVFNA